MIPDLNGPAQPAGSPVVVPSEQASRVELRLAARDWRDSAPGLASWALDNLVTRSDCYGGYRFDRDSGQVATTTRWTVGDPAEPGRWLAPPLALDRLERHFRGSGDPGDLVGCHVADLAATCRWIVVDVDAHGPDDDPAANTRMVAAILAELAATGVPHLLEDSDGRGGYHIWIAFAGRVPMAWAHRFGRYLVRDHAAFGLANAPETFPKGPQHAGKRCGHWVRLPGRHHKREHYSRAWSPGEARWLWGRSAIRALMRLRGDPGVDPDRLVPRDFVAATPGRTKACASRPARPVPPGEGLAAQVGGEPAEVAKARSAIAWLGVDAFEEYGDWIRLGMALTGLGDAGLDLWDDASLWSAKYAGHQDLAARWATLRDEGPDLITLGSLYHRALEAGWDGRFRVTPAPGVPKGPRPSNVGDGPGSEVTPAMSLGWDEEFERQAGLLDDRPESRARLASRLGLTLAGLAVVERSVRFGLKPTNSRRLADGSTTPLGPAWTFREVDAGGRTVGLRRRLETPDDDGRDELGSGDRVAPRPGRPDRVERISRRGLLTNLAAAAADAATIHLVRGVRDFAAVAARGLPCVALPAGARDPDAGLADLAGRLRGDARPLVVPHRAGSADPWDDARGAASALGREPGRGIDSCPFPSEYASLAEYWNASQPPQCRGRES